jgi:glutamate-1-semialdehyde 2,1-aminomutase
MSASIFEQDLRARTVKSLAMYEGARRILPGGVAGHGKYMVPYPIYFQQAHGSRIIDVDGNGYIDLLMGYGIHILGHSPPPVVKAVTEHLGNGTMPGLATEHEFRLASKVREHMPPMEMIRFVNTGSEATAMAIRVARAYRKRDKIARFEGNYHGQHDLVEMSGVTTEGPGDAPIPSPDSLGLPASTANDLLILPYNEPEAAVSLIAEHADELAGVIMEPVSAFGLGCVPAEPEFIQAIRSVTLKHDIPLILDEVVTNLRLGLGGASEYYGVTPDLVCLGKIVGGGFPIGVYGGREDLMNRYVTPTGSSTDQEEKIHQSGTFSGNAISMVAGLAVIKELEKEGVYPYLEKLTARVRSGLQGIAEDLGIQMLVTGIASLFQCHFGVRGIRNRRDRQLVNTSLDREFSQGLLSNGICATPHPLFLSTAHSEKDVDCILETAGTVLEAMKHAAKQG